MDSSDTPRDRRWVWGAVVVALLGAAALSVALFLTVTAHSTRMAMSSGGDPGTAGPSYD